MVSGIHCVTEFFQCFNSLAVVNLMFLFVIKSYFLPCLLPKFLARFNVFFVQLFFVFHLDIYRIQII